jgi:hypothetical protein
MEKKDEGFITIRIKESDHARMTKRVTHDIKIHDVVTAALDALEKVKKYTQVRGA